MRRSSLAGCLLRRRPGGAGRYWYSAGVVAAAAGGGAAHLAGHLGWGHPLLFTLISACGYWGCAVAPSCISAAGAIVSRSAAGTGGWACRSDLTASSYAGQLGQWGCPGSCGVRQGTPGGTVWLIARWLAETGLM